MAGVRSESLEVLLGKKKQKKKRKEKIKRCQETNCGGKRKIMPAHSVTLTWHMAANREEWALRAVRKNPPSRAERDELEGKVVFFFLFIINRCKIVFKLDS